MEDKIKYDHKVCDFCKDLESGMICPKCSGRELGKDGVVDASIPLSEFVLVDAPKGSIAWSPEDYGFRPPNNKGPHGETPHGKIGVWYYKNLELRSFQHDYWLCRKKITNKNGNTEMLQKFRHQILPGDKDWADMVFTKGLK